MSKNLNFSAVCLFILLAVMTCDFASKTVSNKLESYDMSQIYSVEGTICNLKEHTIENAITLKFLYVKFEDNKTEIFLAPDSTSSYNIGDKINVFTDGASFALTEGDVALKAVNAINYYIPTIIFSTCALVGIYDMVSEFEEPKQEEVIEEEDEFNLFDLFMKKEEK